MYSRSAHVANCVPECKSITKAALSQHHHHHCHSITSDDILHACHSAQCFTFVTLDNLHSNQMKQRQLLPPICMWEHCSAVVRVTWLGLMARYDIVSGRARSLASETVLTPPAPVTSPESPMLSHLGVCICMVAAKSELRLHFTVPLWSQQRSDRGHFTQDHPGASKWLKREQFHVFLVSWYILCTANALCFLFFHPFRN